MIKVAKSIIVEGRYDKARLAAIFDANIIETGGFQIFSDEKLMGLIKKLALDEGIIIATDSDKAGFVIRQYIASAVPPERITHIYIPDVFGKERRKVKPSKEGKLGVEGMENELLLKVFAEAGVLNDIPRRIERPITKMDLYELGLSGAESSSAARSRLKELLDLPQRLGTNALLATLNRILTYQQLTELVDKVTK